MQLIRTEESTTRDQEPSEQSHGSAQEWLKSSLREKPRICGSGVNFCLKFMCKLEPAVLSHARGLHVRLALHLRQGD